AALPSEQPRPSRFLGALLLGGRLRPRPRRLGDVAPRARTMVARAGGVARMIELRLVRGPLGDDETRAIVDLYGPADRKYEDPRFATHQFAKNAYGWTLHAFAF